MRLNSIKKGPPSVDHKAKFCQMNIQYFKIKWKNQNIKSILIIQFQNEKRSILTKFS